MVFSNHKSIVCRPYRRRLLLPARVDDTVVSAAVAGITPQNAINLQYVLVPELAMTSRPAALAPAIDLHPAQGIQVSQPRGGIQCSHLVQATVADGE